MEFKFDKQALARIEQEALANFKAEMQPVLDRVHDQHAGEPIDQVLAALRAERVMLDAGTGEETLQFFAETISRGDRVALR